jgi:sarcosine/dimethylglycine N-methyltransferase
MVPELSTDSEDVSQLSIVEECGIDIVEIVHNVVNTVPKPQCDLYTIPPTLRFENELEELTGSGLSATTALDFRNLAAIDSMHYLGHEGTAKMIGGFGNNPPSCVLDIGSGFGGCSRYIAGNNPIQAHVTALELQPDISMAAASITKRCGLSSNVSHVVGNILDENLSQLPREGDYELAFSKLVILHIPFMERPKLWQRVERVLAPGGVLYLEDYFTKSIFTEEETTCLENRIGVPTPHQLPTSDAWMKQLEAAGFGDIEFEDVSSTWTPWIAERAEMYRSNRQRNLRVQGDLITYGMERFYDSAANLFIGGHLGGCVIRAVKKA